MYLSFLHSRKTFPWLIVAKAVVVLVPVIIIISLLNHHFFFSKFLNYTYHPGQRAHSVVPKTPAELLKTADPKLRWRISVDNFLFNVTMPRLIEAVRIRVRLDPGTQNYVALNATVTKGSSVSTIIKATSLDTLDWKHVSSGNVTLWMRDKHITEEKITEGTGKSAKTKTVTTERAVIKYDSIDDFRAKPPDMNLVGLVGIERMAFAKVQNYRPSGSTVAIGHTLRGSHQMYVYAVDETLKLTFDKIDLNRAKGTDNVTVRVAKVGDLTTGSRNWIKTVTVGDDGISDKEGLRGKPQLVSLEIPNVAPGVYYVEINTSEDVLIANLVSAQRFLSFNGRVYIAEGLAYAEPNFSPVTLQTNGSMVAVAANHDQGKQDVTIAGKKVSVKDVKVDHVVSKLTGTTRLDFPKGDIIVTSDGLLSFDGADLLPDGARGVDVSVTAPDVSTFDYIIADYLPNNSTTLEVDQTYKISDLQLSGAGKTLTFSINSPGLQAAGATLGLQDIRVTMVRGQFPWDKVWKKLGLKK